MAFAAIPVYADDRSFGMAAGDRRTDFRSCGNPPARRTMAILGFSKATRECPTASIPTVLTASKKAWKDITPPWRTRMPEFGSSGLIRFKLILLSSVPHALDG